MPGIAQGLAILAMIVITTSFSGLAYAQYGPENNQPVQKQVARTDEGQQFFNFPLVMVIVGSIIGISAVVAYITLLQPRKESKHTTQI